MVYRLYPRGHATAADGMVSLFLRNMSNKAIVIDFGFSVNNGNGKQVAYERTATPYSFGPMGTATGAGGFDLAKRSKLLSSLVEGTLVIEVCIKMAKPTKSDPPTFIPENPSACKTIEDSFKDYSWMRNIPTLYSR
jgi:hypothetical protein